MAKASFVSENPELMKNWDVERNKQAGLFPDKLGCGSSKNAWWLCLVCGGEWEAPVFTRTRNKGTNCPHCNKAKMKKVNKLQKKNTL